MTLLRVMQTELNQLVGKFNENGKRANEQFLENCKIAVEQTRKDIDAQLHNFMARVENVGR